ncbi:MAG: hypothetical protein R3D25_06125 [Geminicoccaceae bacterium]
MALITPHPDFVQPSEAGSPCGSRDTGPRPEFRQRIARPPAANANLSAIERISWHDQAAEPFSVENGMMTPTMKLRRLRIIEQKGALLEGLYTSGK